MAISGQFTNFTAGVSDGEPGGGITVGAVTVNGPTQLTVPITIGAGASTGQRTATVTTSSEVATMTGAFTVTAGGAVDQYPQSERRRPEQQRVGPGHRTIHQFR